MRRDAWRDLIEDVLSGLSGHGYRTVGLVIVFALGSGGLVAALGINATASQQLLTRVTAAALDQVVARPVAGDDGATPHLPDAAAGLAANIDGVVAAGVSVSVSGNVGPVTRGTADDGSALGSEAAAVTGIDPVVLDVLDASVEPAHAAALLDDPATPAVALVGSRLAGRLGITEPGPGVRVEVSGVPVEVVGIVTADDQRGTGLRDSVLVPVPLARALGGDESLVVRTDPGRSFAVSQVLPSAIDPAHPATVATDPVPDLRLLRRGISTDLDSTAGVLAVLMLGLAVITTTSIMTVSVAERTGEIALRRAIGASRRRTAAMFVCEGAAIGVVGGAAGAAAGVVAVLAVATRQGWTAVVPVWLPVVGIVCGLVVGMLAALRAARRASRIDPAIAIRRS